MLELLQLLDAVSHLASLGFEKSYREAIVLMTRSYLSKLSDIGSAESKTLVPEATTERIEVCCIFCILVSFGFIYEGLSISVVLTCAIKF